VSDHCRILDEISAAGCFWLLYTGGEIFARKDFPEIYRYAKSKGFVITLFTNGTLITPEIVELLSEWPPFSVEITLYGITPEVYERVTRVPGSYHRCLEGIRLLNAGGIPLKLKTMALTLNRDEIFAMKRFAEDELGVPFKFDPVINPRIDCSPAPLAFRLRPDEILDLELQDTKRMKEWKEFADLFVREDRNRDCQHVYQCSGGTQSFAIDPYGNLTPCVLTTFDSFDLKNESFSSGWNVFLKQLLEKKVFRKTKCSECRLFSLCGMCPANGYLENQDFDAPNDFLCHLAHLRARALRLPVPSHGDCQYCLSEGEQQKNR
jgi:radical SAM protein with 4Fe4S-binding SPASM domain